MCSALESGERCGSCMYARRYVGASLINVMVLPMFGATLLPLSMLAGHVAVQSTGIIFSQRGFATCSLLSMCL